MIEYRPFRNTDPPGLCKIWCNYAAPRAFFQALTPSILESTVLGKPFFDADGLIVATENDEPIGFAHAGFAPNEDGSGIDTSVGATCMLMVAEPLRLAHVAQELLRRSEQYLQQRGAHILLGGASSLVAPFYLGLYGGATVPGVLLSDTIQLNTFTAAGYTETARTLILQRPLSGFRPVIDRDQIQLKRSTDVRCLPDPAPSSWWEACTIGLTDQFSFTAYARTGGAVRGTVLFWDVEPLASYWGVHARGLCGFHVPASPDREAVAVFLLGEALRMLAASGTTLVEAHVKAVDDPLHPLLTRMGFHEVEQAVTLRKP